MHSNQPMVKNLSKGNVPSNITEVIIGTGELWTPYRELRHLIERSLVDSSPELVDEIQQILTIHKPDFISLLSNKGSNAADRQELRNAGGEGAHFKGHEGKQVLPSHLINETILLSDMFQINEFLALDLLATAETEMDKHPGWGRGLLAVYLYYEGRNAIVQSLLTIVQGIPGKSWSSSVSPKIVELFKNVFNAVFSGDMMDRLLGNFEKTSEKAAMELLDSNLALGDWRHRSEVSKFMRSIRLGLAQIIFGWCAQQQVSWKDTLRLLDYLKAHVAAQREADVTKEDIFLLSSILVCVSNNISVTEVDEVFVKGFKKYIKDNESGNGFHNPELLDFYKWIFYTRTYKFVAENHMSASRGVPPVLSEAKISLLKQDDDFELKTDVFAFLKKYMLLYPNRYSDDENLMRQYHSLFADFICYMSLKLKELKNRSEDASKTAILYYEQGIRRPPNLPQEYENLLECIGLFYFNDNFELAAVYFSPDNHVAALSKFVRSACSDPSSMFISNSRMIAGLLHSYPAGASSVPRQTGHNMCIEHFFKSMMKYLSSFGVELSYDGLPLQRFELHTSKVVMKPQEATSICCYLEIIETLCRRSEAVRHFFCSANFQWVKMCFHMGKIRNVPVEIRAKMIKVAAAMIPTESVSPEVITNLWDVFYKTKLLDQGTADLRTELEDRETRDTVYPLTISLLKLIKALVDARFPQRDYDMLDNDFRAVFDNGAFEPYVAYLCDSILLKISHRSYRNAIERWTIATLALNIVSSLLDVISSFMFQLLCDSPLLRNVRNYIIVSTSFTTAVELEKCQLVRQSWFLYHKDALPNKHGNVMIGLNELLAKTISSSGRPEFLLTIVKFVDHLNPEAHRYAALEIISLLVAEHSEIDLHFYNSITADSNIAVTFRHTVTQMLYDPNCDESLKSVILQLVRSSIVHASPNLSLYLLGVDKKLEFLNPGVQNYPTTILHALIDNCAVLQDAFATFLALVRDPILWQPLLKYLRNNQFFNKLLSSKFPNNLTTLESIGHFLKLMAVELKNSPNACFLDVKFLERRHCKFQDILARFDVDNQSIELPMLEFFDPNHVSKAIETCEIFSKELITKFIRVEMLEALLRAQIRELEKNVVLRLRKSINVEAKEITAFARQLNSMRTTEAAKMLVFDGWRQCLEVIVLSPSILPAVGFDFVTSMLRVLLMKITSSIAPSTYFLRLSAETTLTLCAVANKLKSEGSHTTLHVILNHICNWVAGEMSFPVRGILYSCILYLITMLRNEGISAYGSSLTLIMSTLCKDTFQTSEVGRMQAMNLIGEILRVTANKGLDSLDAAHLYKTALSASMHQNMNSSVRFNATNSVEPKSMHSHSAAIISQSFFEPRTQHDSTIQQGESFQFSSKLVASSKSPYSQTVILNQIVVKGYIRRLVDDLSLVDDVNLIQLFSNKPEKAHMRAMYAFEAKMALLCHIAATGSRATAMLMDVNIINKLTDMNVFALNTDSEIGPQHMRRNYVSSGLTFSLGGMITSEMLPPVGNTQTDSLFSTVFNLFHVMLSTCPKNELLISQMWHFISTHDLSIGCLLSAKANLEPSDANAASSLTALMAKISSKLPANAMNKKQSLYPKLMSILHVFAEEPDSSDHGTRLVRNVMTFLCGHARNKEALRDLREDGGPKKTCRVILLASLDYQKNTHDDVTFGTILKIVDNAAAKVSASAVVHVSPKHLANLITIIECGITLIYLHMEIFLTKSFSDFLSYDQDSKKLRQELTTGAEFTAKQISDMIKLIPHAEYMETLILRLRRLQV